MGLYSAKSNPIVKRVMIFIDGGYLRPKLLGKYNNEDLNYQKFGEFLSKNFPTATRSNIDLIRLNYYDGMPSLEDIEKFRSTESGDQLKKREDKINKKILLQKEYLEKISLSDYCDVKKGRLVMKGDLSFEQKGIDTKIATDMISKSFMAHYDIAILVTGDTDFIEVIEEVKTSGATVVGAYFDEGMPKELLHAYDIRMRLEPYDFRSNGLFS